MDGMKMIRSARYSQFTRLVLLAVLLMASAASTFSQLSMDVTYMPVNRLSPADVDFERSGGTNLLFTLRINNTGGTAVDARLSGILKVNLATGESFEEGVSFLSNVFTIPPAGKMLTNFDLNRSGSIGLERSQIDSRFKTIVDDALASGVMPEGLYIFRMTLVDQSGVSLDGTKEIVFKLKNSWRVDLRSPRDGESTNEFPFFEYSYDGDRAILRVAELGENQSREDALSRRPLMLETEVSGNSFLYSVGRPLENGKSYVWQLSVSQALAGGGVSNVASPIWAFTVTGNANGRSESPILRQLEELFGTRYPQIFEAIRDGGFSPSGSFILNGAPISQSDLLNMLNQLREKADAAELTFE
jgi:hypothetical protein